jgi:amino acid permease
MENRNLKEFSKTLSCAMFLCVITYTGTAAFGYYTFGELVTTDILLSYKPDPEIVVAVIFIAMKTYTTYPIVLENSFRFRFSMQEYIGIILTWHLNKQKIR